MKQKSVYLATALIVGLAFIGVTVAQRPDTNIDPARHPNLAEAQHHILQAFEKIDEAQRANKDQLGGHAESQATARPGQPRTEGSGRIR
jgi:hypothetical protein